MRQDVEMRRTIVACLMHNVVHVTVFRNILAALQRPQVLIHGRYSPWMKALGPGAAIWSRIGPYEVGRSYRLGVLPTWRRRYVIPLYPPSYRTMPSPAWALIPSREAQRICADKALFARFVRIHGLSDATPATWSTDGPIQFPAVLKRTDLMANRGVVIVADAGALAARLAEPDWRGHPVIVQEYIVGAAEETLHAICVKGRIIWHFANVHQLESAQSIRSAPDAVKPRASTVSVEDLALFARIFAALAYEGPATIDFKRRPDGRIAVFEINPRLGGTLMRPEFTEQRAAAVATILAHARLHAPGEDDFSAAPQ